MKKLFPLIKASMTENMSMFRIKKKNQSEKTRKILPIFLFSLIFFYMWVYSNMLMEKLDKFSMTYIVLTIFVLFTTILTLIEGIYKSSSLLFNTKDDDLMFSLPIKKETVLFIRVFKFYVFELVYNSMILLPSMIAYLKWVNVSWTYYLVTILALLLFPMIPIAISCVLGMLISSISAKFKYKNIIQIIITTLMLLGVLYLSYNFDAFIFKLVEKATSINDFITKLYYPAGLYINLVTDFNIKDLILFIITDVSVFVLIIILLSRVYFKINSSVNVNRATVSNKEYIIKSNPPIKSFIKKELNRFIASPVFVTNAAFGLVLFIIGCILLAFRFDSLSISIIKALKISNTDARAYVPLLLFVFIVISSLMTSITSSMISLEGKTFNILKSLPIDSYIIIKAKVLAAVSVMIPCILFGDIIIFSRFEFSILEIIIILIESIILPFVSSTIGIIVNLLFPKMDALNDTEIIKQSMSSMVAVFIGMILLVFTGIILYNIKTIDIDMMMFIVLMIYIVIYIILHIYLKLTGRKRINEINV